MKSGLFPLTTIKQNWPNSASYPLYLGLDKGKCLKTSKQLIGLSFVQCRECLSEWELHTVTSLILVL